VCGQPRLQSHRRPQATGRQTNGPADI